MQASAKTNFLRLLVFLFAISSYSCRSYNQNIMFKTKGNVNQDKLKQSLVNVEQNYIIKPNDILDVRVYTNKGERIFDPNGELPFGVPGGGSSSGTRSNSVRTTNVPGAGSARASGQLSNTEFLVQHDGIVKLPLIDYVKVSGLTLLQADSLLQTLYVKYYVDPFVTTKVTNNRVFVMGSLGGGGMGNGGGQGIAGQVIQMNDDNMTILEVLAQAGGIPQGGKAHNIRLIRNYNSPEPFVQILDLTTIDGMRQASLAVEPNDVIYVEPNQRIFFEVLRDVTPVLSTFLSIVSTYLLITTLSKD